VISFFHEHQNNCDDYKIEMTNQIPAWGTLSQWKEANQTFEYLLKRYKNSLFQVVKLALEIQNNLSSVFQIQDELCRETCTKCPDPCCLNATVWADFKDLLFIHLTKKEIPVLQLIEKSDDSCRYHSPIGCRLSRFSRPWVCTLYLCPAQKERFRALTSEVKSDYDKKVNYIKQSRKELEDLFIDLVT